MQRLDPLFKARSVAIVGASKDTSKWGYVVLKHLIEGGFEGEIYPVNPGEKELLGLKVYESVSKIPRTADLAVIVVPPPAVVPVIKECTGKGIKAGIVITAGFAELGGVGGRLQTEMIRAAHDGGMVLVGPNCNGIMCPWEKLYIEFPPFFVPPGPIAIVAQSGNVMDVLARQIMLMGLGCSVCVASGNEAVLHSEDYLEYLADDPHTRVILCYIEGFKDGRRFIDIAGKVSRKKPIVMVKAGKTQAGARAAASHTASIAGSDAVFDAVCRQAGVIRAQGLDDMLNTGIALLRQPLPQGCRVGIVTAGGGWGVLAADACAGLGLNVVKFPEELILELDKLLPAWWNRGNPVDLVAGATPDNIFKAIELVISSPSVNAVVMLSIMPALRIRGFGGAIDEAERESWGNRLVQEVTEVIERFNGLAQKYGKPLVVASAQVFADAVGETRITYALGRHELICHHQPQEAAEVLNALVRYGEFLGRK